MSLISFDAQSLLLDGRRIWLVGGTIPYARLPQAQWRSRFRAARAAHSASSRAATLFTRTLLASSTVPSSSNAR